MTIDAITKAAQERLDALDAEAKPHEDALAAIDVERARLRLMIAAGKDAPHLPVCLNPFPLIPEQPTIYPGAPQWVPPISPSAAVTHAPFQIDPAGTQIVCRTIDAGKWS